MMVNLGELLRRQAAPKPAAPSEAQLALRSIVDRKSLVRAFEIIGERLAGEDLLARDKLHYVDARNVLALEIARRSDR